MPERATKPQINYILILFNDLEYDTHHKQIQFLRLELKRNNIYYIDEITKVEASIIITELKNIKARND
jgi:hypothetical protein